MDRDVILRKNLTDLAGAPLVGHPFESHVFRHDRTEFIDRVERVNFKGGIRVLDIACGYGQDSWALAQFNDHVIAADRSESMLATTHILAERWGAPNVSTERQFLPD